ncbi:MAG: D-alanine--D-alanine ligase [Patescibacteria group bacterium]
MTIGVLKGGPSSEHEVSLKTAENVERALLNRGFFVKPIFVDKNGWWHIKNFKVSPPFALDQVDGVFNAMHGEYGEDGQVQKILENHGTPFTGSGSMSSILAMDKLNSKKIFQEENMPLARHIAFDKGGEKEVRQKINFGSLDFPLVVKPVDRGSSVGVGIAHNAQELNNLIAQAFKYSDQVMIEEYLSGTEITCGVLENYKDQKIFALPPTEIVPRLSDFFDYDSKYESGGSNEITPARLSDLLLRRAQDIAKTAHRALGCRHYSRTDMIVRDGKIYILEVNALPGLTATSLLPQGAQSAGLSFDDLIEHLVLLALGKK